MTRADRDLFRGWQAALQGQPDDPYQSDKWREGYRIGLATLAKRGAE